jgi:two-component system, OmpR family, phosphate regulon response regulator PhoB
MQNTKPPDILIIEDELDIREVLELNFTAEGYSVASRSDGPSGLAAGLALKPGLVLLDLMLPGMDGLEICRALKRGESTSAIPIIMLTAKGRESDIVLGLGLGAEDYVTKPFSMAVLLARIKVALRRGRQPAAAGQPMRYGPFSLDRDRHRLEVEGEEIEVTPTEFRLMEALLQAPGRVYSRELLLSIAVGDDVLVGERTVDTHMSALRKKLGSARQCIRTIWGVGYRLELPEGLD